MYAYPHAIKAPESEDSAAQWPLAPQILQQLSLVQKANKSTMQGGDSSVYFGKPFSHNNDNVISDQHYQDPSLVLVTQPHLVVDGAEKRLI